MATRVPFSSAIEAPIVLPPRLWIGELLKRIRTYWRTIVLVSRMVSLGSGAAREVPRRAQRRNSSFLGGERRPPGFGHTGSANTTAPSTSAPESIASQPGGVTARVRMSVPASHPAVRSELTP